MSGDPTFFTKIGQTLLCTRSSTQIQYLYKTCIYLSQIVQYMQCISNTATWAHKQYSIYISIMSPTIYPIVTRVPIFSLLINTYIKIRHFNTCILHQPKPQPAFFTTQPLGRAVPSHAPCTCKIISLDRVS